MSNSNTNNETSEFLIILIKLTMSLWLYVSHNKQSYSYNLKVKRSWNIQNSESLEPNVEYSSQKHHIWPVRSQQRLSLLVVFNFYSNKTWFISISGKFKSNITITFLSEWVNKHSRW